MESDFFTLLSQAEFIVFHFFISCCGALSYCAIHCQVNFEYKACGQRCEVPLAWNRFLDYRGLKNYRKQPAKQRRGQGHINHELMEWKSWLQRPKGLFLLVCRMFRYSYVRLYSLLRTQKKALGRHKELQMLESCVKYKALESLKGSGSILCFVSYVRSVPLSTLTLEVAFLFYSSD